MKTVFITGASGIFAQKLINLFNDNSYNVIASSRNIDNINRINGVKYINNDDIISTDILKNVDIIINCAFPRKQEPQILTEAIQFYDCLVLRAVEMNVKGIVNISSQSVYDSYRQMPATEHTTPKPFDNYGLTKYVQELLGLATVQNSNTTRLTNIRLASLIGIEYPERVINKIIKNAHTSHKIAINNDKNVFGYFDTDDAAKGIYKFVTNSSPDNWETIYNLGAKYEEQKDFEYIARCIQKLFEKHNINVDLDITKAQKADKLCLLDSSKFYKTANWEPETTLEQSIEKIFNMLL